MSISTQWLSAIVAGVGVQVEIINVYWKYIYVLIFYSNCELSLWDMYRNVCNSLISLSIPKLNDDISWPNSLNQGRTLRRSKWTKSYIWEKRGKILLRSFFLFIEKVETRSEGKKYSCGKKGTEFGSMIFVDAAAILSFVRHRAEGLHISTSGPGTLTLPWPRCWSHQRRDSRDDDARLTGSRGGERRTVRTQSSLRVWEYTGWCPEYSSSGANELYPPLLSGRAQPVCRDTAYGPAAAAAAEDTTELSYLHAVCVCGYPHSAISTRCYIYRYLDSVIYTDI